MFLFHFVTFAYFVFSMNIFLKILKEYLFDQKLSPSETQQCSSDPAIFYE